MLILFFNFENLCYTKNMEKYNFKKSLLYTLGLCAIALCSMFMFSACLFTLDTPQPTLKGGVLSWEAVASASGYNVSFEKDGVENVIPTKETAINISGYVESGTYKIKVQATTNSIIRNNSAYSQAKTITTDGEISTPDAFKLITKSNQVVVSFQNVLFADSYSIKIVDPGEVELDPVNVPTNALTEIYEVDITKYLLDAGDYKISVKANKVNSDESISSSAYTEQKIYTKTIALFAPNVAKVYDNDGEFTEEREDHTTAKYNDNIKYVGDNLVVTLSEVGNASKYIVSLYGSYKAFESTTNVVTIPKSELPKITNGDEDKTAIQIIHAQVKSNSLYYNASEYSEGYVFFGVDVNKTNLGKLKITNPYSGFVGENEFDFCANSQNELNTLVYFAMANRIEKFQFFQEYYTQEILTVDKQATWFMNQDYMSIATNTYYETKNIASSTSEDTTGKLILYIDNKVTGSPTETATVDKNGDNQNTSTQVEFNVMTNYSTLPKASDKRYTVDEDEITAETKVALPILKKLEANKKVNVYTSDQLYLAVQAGYYPVFVGESQAKQIWNKAVDVLVGKDETLGIIDSTMTDVEKALAIFDWVCYNNCYDYNLSSRSNEALVQRFRGFYLEGIFLDDGQAVCDGISKAYSLLCNMSGVYCYKVSGEGITNSGKEGHAWNKVGIYDDGTESYTYYLVDCTWNDILLTLPDSTELGYALVHKNFLTKDDSKHLEKNPSKLSSNALSATSYDYFENKTVSLNNVEYNLVIKETTTNDPWSYMPNLRANLDLEYAKNLNNGLNHLEIKVFNGYASNFSSAMNTGNAWYIFEREREGGYTTFFILHK